jgi:hypothetical protein
MRLGGAAVMNGGARDDLIAPPGGVFDTVSAAGELFTDANNASTSKNGEIFITIKNAADTIKSVSAQRLVPKKNLQGGNSYAICNAGNSFAMHFDDSPRDDELTRNFAYSAAVR